MTPCSLEGRYRHFEEAAMRSSWLTEDGDSRSLRNIVTNLQTTRYNLQTLSLSSSSPPICHLYQISPLLPSGSCHCPPRHISTAAMQSGLTAIRSGVGLCNRRPRERGSPLFPATEHSELCCHGTKLCLPPPGICSSTDRAEPLAGCPQLKRRDATRRTTRCE